VSQELESIVHLGNLTALATWNDREIISLRFPTRSFSQAQWQAVEHLRHCPSPLPLSCDGRGDGHCHIVGHESDHNSVTFHLARCEPA